MPLLSEDDYPSIRRNISFSLSETLLPDPMIEEYADEGEGWVTAQTDDTGTHAVHAARYYTSYLLVPMVQGQLQAAHDLAADGRGPSALDWKPLAEELLRRAMRELALILEEEGVETMPTFFTLAEGRRGL